MPHTKVQAQLKINLQTAYRQALDADKKLDELNQSGQAKFTAIFSKDEHFTTQSNRFKPYVQELATDIEALSTETEDFAKRLNQLLPKLAVLLQTLNTFKKNAR